MSLIKHQKYLQIALNSTVEEAEKIIQLLPISPQIIIEVGTPLIKVYGVGVVSNIREFALARFSGSVIRSYYQKQAPLLLKILQKSPSRRQMLALLMKQEKERKPETIKKEEELIPFAEPYIVADIKCDDLARKEVGIVAQAGATAATCLGVAPVETIDSFIENCENFGIDSMVDMMNVENPLLVLKKLKKIPRVVMLHRGVDETEFDKEKQIPYYQIKQIRGNFNCLISVAGGDTLGEVERAFFNDADIVVVWKSFYRSSAQTTKLAQRFIEKSRI